jgi:hypothetical protein
MQTRQIDGYKSQIQNLQQQLILQEERIKHYDSDRTGAEKRILDVSRAGESKERDLVM